MFGIQSDSWACADVVDQDQIAQNLQYDLIPTLSDTDIFSRQKN